MHGWQDFRMHGWQDSGSMNAKKQLLSLVPDNSLLFMFCFFYIFLHMEGFLSSHESEIFYILDKFQCAFRNKHTFFPDDSELTGNFRMNRKLYEVPRVYCQ